MAGKPFSFMCDTCGKEHFELPHLGHRVPDPYMSAPPERQARDFQLTTDTCVMRDGTDMHYFVRGALLVPIHGIDEPFGWGLWVSVSESNYNRFVSIPDEEHDREKPYFGWLMNRIGGYPDTFCLKTMVHPRSGNKRPLIELEPTDHPLAVEQREGISLKRAIELVSPFMHGPGTGGAERN